MSHWLAGLFPPIPTAFSPDGELAPVVRPFLDYLAAGGVDGVVALGSNGEAASLSDQERLRWLREVRAALPGLRLLAGTGADSTRATIERTLAAADAGAEAALVITPFYYRGDLTVDAVLSHFEKVASASPIPILIYNVPAHTGWDFHPAGWASKLAAHLGIAGIKDSSGDLARLPLLRSASGPDFVILVGAGERMADALAAGADGAIAALANLAPAACAGILRAARAGKSAAELQRRIAPLGEALSRRLRVPGLKAALALMGFDHGPPRPPLPALSQAELPGLKRLLEDAQLLPGLVPS